MVEPVKAEEFGAFIRRVFNLLGVPEKDVSEVAHMMVEADMLGYGTHGVLRLRLDSPTSSTRTLAQ